MKSLDPRDYELQPLLEPPAGYICVVRDVASDKWRIEGARHPKRLVEGILAASESRFGIELVSILKTEDLDASAATLYEQHHAELGEEWLALDEYQLDALRRSILQIDAHASHYLRLADAKEKPEPVNKGAARGRFTRTRRDRWGLRLRQDNSPRQPLYRLYGAKSLKDYEEPEPKDWRQDMGDPERWLLVTSERVGKFLNSGAGKATQAVLILLLAALLCIMDACS